MKELLRRDIVAVLNDLPHFCYSRLNTSGAPIIVKRGHRGYWPVGARCAVEELNADLGLTAAAVTAMSVGSMMGFEVPGADPLNYPELATSSNYDAKLRHQWACRRHDWPKMEIVR